MRSLPQEAPCASRESRPACPSEHNESAAESSASHTVREFKPDRLENLHGHAHRAAASQPRMQPPCSPGRPGEGLSRRLRDPSFLYRPSPPETRWSKPGPQPLLPAAPASSISCSQISDPLQRRPHPSCLRDFTRRREASWSPRGSWHCGHDLCCSVEPTSQPPVSGDNRQSAISGSHLVPRASVGKRCTRTEFSCECRPSSSNSGSKECPRHSACAQAVEIAKTQIWGVALRRSGFC